MFPSIISLQAKHSSGFALVLVLAFVALLTGVCLAFFSNALLQRQVSNSSANITKADILAQGAIDQITSDLKREIEVGSTVTSVSAGGVSSKVYIPTASINAIPANAGVTRVMLPAAPNGLENLVKRSSSTSVFAPGVPSRAAAASSKDAPLKGRSITNDKWNAALFLPTKSATDLSPAPVAFQSPDWILMARDGTNPTTITGVTDRTPSNQGYVMGRYAYTIYNEGQLLDINFAGSPVNNTARPLSPRVAPYKNSLAYADLGGILNYLNPAPSVADQARIINALVGWRNYSSAESSSSSFPDYSFSSTVPANGLTAFDLSVIQNSNGFLKTSNSTIFNGRSDRAFVSRQDLIKFLHAIGPSVNLSVGQQQQLLQYLTTYTRAIDQPSFSPDPLRPKIIASNGGNDMFGKDFDIKSSNINPSFLQARAASAFTRNDGSAAKIGEPLVKQRFALNRLAWLTYKGVSGNRPTTAPPSLSSGPDYDIYLLENNYGLSSRFLAQGTAENVHKYFGLSWVSDNRATGSSDAGDGQMKWVYNHQTNSPLTSAQGSGVPIKTLDQVAAAGREPDFVELLKAAITAGSLGKAATVGAFGTPDGYQNQKDRSLDAQIIQIVANIIDQSDADGYPTRILFSDGTWPTMHEYRGVEDVPYFYRVRSMYYRVKDSDPSVSYVPTGGTNGGKNTPNASPGDPYPNTEKPLLDSGIGVAFQVPEIWNPHSWNNGSSLLIGPRPKDFRLVAINAQPTVKAPPSGADPNQITVMGFLRDANIGVKNSTIVPAVITKPAGILKPRSYTEDSTALYFTIPDNRLDLFREPTLLFRPGVPEGSRLHFGGDPAGNPDEAKNMVFDSGESLIQSYIKANYNGYKGINTVNSNVHFDWPVGGNAGNLNDDQIYLGLYLGAFPLRWVDGTYNTAALTVNYSGGSSLTYRLQYKDASMPSGWATYDEKFAGLVGVPNRGLNTGSAKAGNFLDFKLLGNNADGHNYSWADPRTSRFGGLFNNYQYNQGGDFMNQWSSVGSTSQIAGAKQGAMLTMRANESTAINPNYLRAKTTFPVEGFFLTPSPDTRPGFWCQNNPDNGGGITQYFADPDNVVRRGMSAYVPSTSSAPAMLRPGGLPVGSPASSTNPSGLPLSVAMDFSSASNNSAATQISGEVPSRPIVLNRPFRSVAELGYVFSGTPWRNLDFMTPESGSAPLLDLLCINSNASQNALVAGKVNLNTLQIPVLQAILSGAYENEFNVTNSTLALTGSGTAVTALSIAKALVTRTSDTSSSLGTGSGPLRYTNDLVGRWVSSVPAGAGLIKGSQSYKGFSGTQTSVYPSSPPANPPNLSSLLFGDTTSSGYYALSTVQRYREATVRALANVGQTRVWNLMIDLVSQTGSYPENAADLSKFVVEGERRVWVHISIDRFTGEIIDKQIETINE